jgi:actin-like ATPase involved in cell morphogenesis
MNSEINLLIDQIKRPLQEGVISDWKEYDKLVKDIISQSSELQRIYKKHRSNL